MIGCNYDKVAVVVCKLPYVRTQSDSAVFNQNVPAGLKEVSKRAPHRMNTCQASFEGQTLLETFRSWGQDT